MSLRDTLQKALTPELFDQVTDALGDDFNFDLVPRTRLNKVIKQRDDARAANPDWKQQSKTTPKAKAKKVDEEDDDDDDPDGGIDLEALKQQYEQQSKDAVKAVRIQYAALDKLRAANVVDPEMLFDSKLIDKSKLDFDDKGQLTGLDDMLTTIKEAKPHLFGKKDDGVPAGTGKNGGNPDEGVKSKDDFLKLDVDKQIAFKQNNPELFKQFMSTI